ncbi:hypothetical protein [Streptomyces sp. NPDC058872]|uniref:hypothetical protein n=1 Tax=Streptomyces sp. NPDC058872 TaxID=3346661 RepID=UPI0036894F94
MENPTRRTAATGTAALLAASLVAAVAVTASEQTPTASDRITSVTQLKQSIRAAAELEQQDAAAADVGGGTGGQVTRVGARAAC